MTNDQEGKLWGGRFQTHTAPEMFQLSQSIHFDWRLAKYDLIQTLAHAIALKDAGILTASEYDALKQCALELSKDIDSGEVTYSQSDEDVHSAIERLITQALPEIGTKIRTGRSRNDQVATDLRLYVRDMNQKIAGLVLDLSNSIIDQAHKYSDLPAPGYTHLQRAQPVTLGHELAKHVHALLRDFERLKDSDKRIAVSPLGSGALAGSSFSVDVEKIADVLDFNLAAFNSIDAISDRDFVVEFIFNISLLGVHLSRIAEEVVLWTSSEFGFAELDDAWSTGSSLMPQKKNPDIAELTRGKSGRLIGNLVALLTLLKALPFGYNRDLQEDKEPLFDSVDQMLLVLPAMSGLIASLRFNDKVIAETSLNDHSAATDVADYLVRRMMPFKEAHEITGKLVLLAQTKGVWIHELSLDDFKSVSTLFDADIAQVLQVQAILGARSSNLGTAPLSVKKQLRQLESELKASQAWVESPLVRTL
jgi:argininosuccinate lyase